MRPPVQPRPSQRELGSAYAAGAQAARADAEAHAGQPVPGVDTLRAKAAGLYKHDELQRTWVDGYVITTASARELAR